jgi:hypothetical protein
MRNMLKSARQVAARIERNNRCLMPIFIVFPSLVEAPFMGASSFLF